MWFYWRDGWNSLSLVWDSHKSMWIFLHVSANIKLFTNPENLETNWIYQYKLPMVWHRYNSPLCIYMQVSIYCATWRKLVLGCFRRILHDTEVPHQVAHVIVWSMCVCVCVIVCAKNMYHIFDQPSSRGSPFHTCLLHINVEVCWSHCSSPTRMCGRYGHISSKLKPKRRMQQSKPHRHQHQQQQHWIWDCQLRNKHMQSIHIPHTQMEYNLKEQNFRSLGHSPNAEVIRYNYNYYGTVQYSPMKLHQTALGWRLYYLLYLWRLHKSPLPPRSASETHGIIKHMIVWTAFQGHKDPTLLSIASHHNFPLPAGSPVRPAACREKIQM